MSGDHADFRTRGKVFAYFLNNHHGSQRFYLSCVYWLSRLVRELSDCLVAPKTLVKAFESPSAQQHSGKN
jgi:hypothetical protein